MEVFFRFNELLKNLNNFNNKISFKYPYLLVIFGVTNALMFILTQQTSEIKFQQLFQLLSDHLRKEHTTSFYFSPEDGLICGN